MKLNKCFLMLPIILICVSCGQKEKKEIKPIIRPVKTMVVSGGEHTHSFYPGKVKAGQQVDLSFRVFGPLIELPVKEGDKIQKGQLLAKIDQRDFNIAFSKSEAGFNKAKADFMRSDTLYKSNAVSKAEFEKDKANFEVAQANFDIVKANLDDTELKAPFSGFIGRIFVDNYQEVQAKQPILSLLDLDNIKIIIDVSEEVAATVKKDDNKKIVVSFTSLPGREFDLEVKEYARQADPVTQTYRVTLTMPRPEDIRILPGMTAEVRVSFFIPQAESVYKFIVPSIAVFAGDDGQFYLWVVNPDQLTVHQREVKVGSVTGVDAIEILNGIEAGEQIVVAGISKIREGMKIRLME